MGNRSVKGQRGLKMQIRRFNLICIQIKAGVTKEQLILNVNTQMGVRFSESTFEKDMKVLKDELRCPIVFSKRTMTYGLVRTWSFIEALSRFANATEEDLPYRSELIQRKHDRQLRETGDELRDLELKTLSDRQMELQLNLKLLETELNTTRVTSPDFDRIVKLLNQDRVALDRVNRKLMNMMDGRPINGYLSPIESQLTA